MPLPSLCNPAALSGGDEVAKCHHQEVAGALENTACTPFPGFDKINHSMKTNALKLLCGIVLFGTVASVPAQPTFTCTETGFLTGSLNGVNFNNAEVTFTTVADSADITSVLLDGTFPSYLAPGITTIQIPGFSLATFNGPDLFGTYTLDLSAFDPGVGTVGMLDLTALSGMLGNITPHQTTTFQRQPPSRALRLLPMVPMARIKEPWQ